MPKIAAEASGRSADRAILARAKALAAEGDSAAGMSLVDDLIARDPASFDGWFVKARLELRSNALDRAGSAIERAIAIEPKGKAMLLAARIALRRGRPDAARGYLERVAPAAKEYAEAATLLASLAHPGSVSGQKLAPGAAAAGGQPGEHVEPAVLTVRPVRPLSRFPASPALPPRFPAFPPDWPSAQRLALIQSLFAARDYAPLYALLRHSEPGDDHLATVLRAYAEARLHYQHQCFETAAAAAERFLAAPIERALPEPEASLARFEIETLLGRSRMTIGQGDRVRYTPGLAGPKPTSELRRELDLVWRSDPVRGQQLAERLAFGEKPPVRAAVLACTIPLLGGDVDRAAKNFDALHARYLGGGSAIPAEFALCGVRVARERGDFAGQVRFARGYFAAHGLECPRLDREIGLGFESFGLDLQSERVAGPRVTVIITAFNAEATLGYAIRSVLAQSHADLEVIAVDDCSTDGTLDLLRQFAAQDGRVRVIANKRNLGTYASKNVALAEATGRYYTIQDADDWSHPRRIERHVAMMEAEDRLVASASNWIRLDPSGRPLVRPSLGVFTHRNPGSAMVRMDALRDRIGGYDPVRIDADHDQWLRLLAAFGPERIVRLTAPLAIGRHHAQSLTRSGVGAQDEELYSPVRSQYRLNGLRWRMGQVDGDFRIDPAMPRRFPAPEEMLGQAGSG